VINEIEYQPLFEFTHFNAHVPSHIEPLNIDPQFQKYEDAVGRNVEICDVLKWFYNQKKEYQKKNILLLRAEEGVGKAQLAGCLARYLSLKGVGVYYKE
jgi:DNA replication protein DnaC